MNVSEEVYSTMDFFYKQTLKYTYDREKTSKVKLFVFYRLSFLWEEKNEPH